MEIIERVFCLLKDKHLKSKDLADFLNVNPSVLSTWKTRGTPPPTEYLIRICDFLGISVSYLLTGEADKTVSVSPGITQLQQVAELMSETDRLLLAGAILQEIRRCGRFDAAAFLAPSAVAPADERAHVDHDAAMSATQPDNTLSLPMAKKDRQPEADGQEEKTRFIPMAARGGSPFPEGGMWYTEEQYQRILAAIEALPPMDPDKIKDL